MKVFNLLNRALAVRSFSDDFEIPARRKSRTQNLPHDRIIVGHNDGKSA
jgi:hypothetical protein